MSGTRQDSWSVCQDRRTPFVLPTITGRFVSPDSEEATWHAPGRPEVSAAILLDVFSQR